MLSRRKPELGVLRVVSSIEPFHERISIDEIEAITAVGVQLRGYIQLASRFLVVEFALTSPTTR